MLSVILGELEPLSGSCTVRGRVAYASQEPWTFPGTIRQNILCGSPYDEQRYQRVIQVTALQADLDQFPHGDETLLVGERGISVVSGGQKARIGLARCLYVRADIYLLDDPLSAADARVGRHIFTEAIRGFLGDKICILVTHHLEYLEEADRILIIRDVG